MSFTLDRPTVGTRTRRGLTALLAASALIAGGSLAAAPAQAAPNATINVTVQTPAGEPLPEDNWVELITDDGSTWGDYHYDEYADEDGIATFTDVEPGRYTFRVGSETIEDTYYPSQYLGGGYTAIDTPAAVVGDAETKNVTFTLKAGVSVSGTVRSTDGAPLEDATVRLAYAYKYGSVPGFYEWETWDSTSTDANGNYTFNDVPGGSWSTFVEGDDSTSPGQYLDRWYGDVRDNEFAKPVSTNANANVNGIDVRLPKGASVTGLVRGAGGAVLNDVEVDAVELRKDGFGFEEIWNWRDGGTDGDGRFRVDYLEAGTYTLYLNDYSDGHPEQYLGGVTGLGGATRFTVTSGQVTTVDPTMSKKPFAAASTPSIKLDKTKVAYGQSAKAEVTVTPGRTEVQATGTVTLKDGNKVLGTKTLTAGKTSFDLPKSLTIGEHELIATFTSDGVVANSTSLPAKLTVTKAKATVKAKANKAKTSVQVTVKSKLKATGKVVLKQGKKTIDSAKLKKRKATLSLTSLDAGKNKLRVVYTGSKKVAADSKKLTVKIS